MRVPSRQRLILSTSATLLSLGWLVAAPIVAIADGEPGDRAALEKAASGCSSTAGQDTAKVVQTRYEGIRDLKAGFEQTNESASFGGTPLMSDEPKRGEVVFAKPGKMRWAYREPEPSLVVSNGSTLWIHDIAAESVTRLAVTEGFLSGAALQFLLGDGKILDSFEVTATQCSPERVVLDLVPLEDATYERLGLVADPRTGDVVATSVLDLFGNLTHIEFSGIKTNLSPSPETFELEVPEGVELIEYDADGSS